MLKFVYFILLIIFIIFSGVFYYNLDNYYEIESKKKIEQALFFDKAIQAYVRDFIKPTVGDLKHEEILEEDYFDPVLLSSTFAVRHINLAYQDLLQQSKYNSNKSIELKVVSSNPTNEENLADPFEANILRKLNDENLQEYAQKITKDGKATQFYAVAVEKNTQGCLRCHGDYRDAPKGMIELYGKKNGFNEKVGEIRALIAIYNPIQEDQENMMQFFYIIELLALAIILTIIIIITYYTKVLQAKDAIITKQTKFAAMGEMISMIAHQWRQPLTGMSMTVENLKLDIELEDIEPDRWEKSLNIVSEQINYLSNTITDFTNFFKPKQQTQTFELHKFIQDSLNIIGSSLKSHGINIINKFDNDIKLTTHKNDLTQIVLNIVNNAKDAYVLNNLDNRDVTIHTYTKASFVCISIKDNAGGIPEDIIEKIFDPYFSTKDEKNGTGLGLYMSKMIIEDHLNGELDVHVVDNSTEFVIKLKR